MGDSLANVIQNRPIAWPSANTTVGSAITAVINAQAGVLHQILGVRAVSGNPACQRLGIAEMRQHHSFETRIVIA
jgi:hypothetical protein